MRGSASKIFTTIAAGAALTLFMNINSFAMTDPDEDAETDTTVEEPATPKLPPAEQIENIMAAHLANRSYYKNHQKEAGAARQIMAGIADDFSEGKIVMTDRLFDAAPSVVARHFPLNYARERMEHMLVQSVKDDQKYAVRVLGLLRQSHSFQQEVESMRALTKISLLYPSMREDVFDAIEDILESNNERPVIYAIRAMEYFFTKVKEPSVHHERAFEMLETLLEQSDNKKVRYWALSGLRDFVEKYDAFSPQMAERLMDKAMELDIEGRTPIFLARAIADKHPKHADRLMELSEGYLGPQYNADIHEVAVTGIYSATKLNPALHEKAAALLLPLTASSEWEVARSSVSSLAAIARDSEPLRQRIVDHLITLKPTQSLIGTLIIGLGGIGEKDARFAEHPFRMAEEILTTGSDKDVETTKFEVAYAMEVASAIATEHEQYRVRAFAAITTAMQNKDSGGWYHDQLVPIAAAALVEIGTADETYAKKAIDFFAAAPVESRMFSNIPDAVRQNCGLLPYAENAMRNVLKEKFGSAVTMSDEEKMHAEWVEKVADRLHKATPESCRAEAEKKPAKDESGSRIKTGYIFFN